MSGIDDELQQAVAASEAVAAEAPVPPVTAPVVPPPSARRGLGLLIALLVMAGGIVVLALWGFDGAAVYAVDVDQIVAEREELAKQHQALAATGVADLEKREKKLYERRLRVQGSLVKGSLMRRDKPCEYRFRVGKKQKELEVHYAQCVVPDTFRDRPDMDVDVTAEGKLTREGHFEASQIMSKCPSKYEMKERAGRGEKAPHGGAVDYAANPG